MSSRKVADVQSVNTEYLGTGLLTPDEVAQLLRVDERTLANWRYRGIGPVFTKLGGLVRYSRPDLDSFVIGSRQTMTGHDLAA